MLINGGVWYISIGLCIKCIDTNIQKQFVKLWIFYVTRVVLCLKENFYSVKQ